MSLINVCAYCEASRDEIVAKIAANNPKPLTAAERSKLEQEALQYVLVAGFRVLLCPEDRIFPPEHPKAGQMRPALSEAEQWEHLEPPIVLPAGLNETQHECLMLELLGKTSQLSIKLLPNPNYPGYLVGRCKHCFAKFLSPNWPKTSGSA
jgi:hypothetical protein